MPGGGSPTGAPLNETAPRVGAMRPASMRRIVDLPQPEGPSRLTKRPRGTSKLMSWIAVTAPKVLPTPSTAISGRTSASNFMDQRFRLERLLEQAFLLHHLQGLCDIGYGQLGGPVVDGNLLDQLALRL